MRLFSSDQGDRPHDGGDRIYRERDKIEDDHVINCPQNQIEYEIAFDGPRALRIEAAHGIDGCRHHRDKTDEAPVVCRKTDSRHGQWKYRDYQPFQGKDSEVSAWTKENFYKEWAEIMDARRVFNCITVWVPFNEAWCQFDTPDAVAFTRAKDPTRLINPASGGNHNENCGDILDCHNYPNPAQYLWSPTVANVVGEYGGIGLPLEGHLWQPDKNWGYIKYKNSKDVTDAYERYARQLIDLVGRGTSGAVYTQTTDVEIEVNGLMTYDRAVIKIDEARVREINRSVIEALK